MEKGDKVRRGREDIYEMKVTRKQVFVITKGIYM